MTNRDDIREQFSPLLDGELSPEERAVVEAALSDDAELLRELDSLKRVDDLFRALPAETAPGDFEDAIRKRVHPRMVAAAAAAPPPRRAKSRRLWVGGLAAAAVLAVCAGVIAFNVNRYSAPTQMAANYDMAAKEAPKPAAAQMESESLRDRNWSASKSAPMPAGGVAPADAPAAGSAPLDAAARSEEMAALGYAGPSAPSEESKGREDFPIGLERQTATKGAAAGAVVEADRQKMDDVANGIVDERVHVTRGAMSPDAAPIPASLPAREMQQKIEPESAEKDVEQISLGREAEIAPPPAMSEPVAAAVPEPPVPVEQGSAPAAETEIRRMQSVAQTGVAGDRKAGSKDSGAREIGGRTFTLREGVWYEDGYNAEPISNVARQSELLRELMTKHTGLRDLLEFREAVVFKVSDRWYKLVPNPEDPRN